MFNYKIIIFTRFQNPTKKQHFVDSKKGRSWPKGVQEEGVNLRNAQKNDCSFCQGPPSVSQTDLFPQSNKSNGFGLGLCASFAKNVTYSCHDQ